ncbi:MAG TPA: radical SAM protein [Candidatus Lokiarchaeia archaeon]|nr:radical SAM protein [Candidatus Lokiarchaeia archaeon]
MLIKITEESQIPVFGLDFIGILDRGTNLIEVRPTTLCNLRCGYCYANSGNYDNEFEIDEGFLVNAFKEVACFKELGDIEAHVDPYGEGLLYKDIFQFINDMKGVEGVCRTSMQSNGTLLNDETIGKLRDAGLNQINVTVNAMDPTLARKLACRDSYDLEALLATIPCLLDQHIDIVLAPVWFFGVNDAEIEKIIVFYKDLKERYPGIKEIRIGIQNYLVYKTGRKLGKVRQREFNFFYKQLRALEKKYDTKLLLSPKDFDIHPAPVYKPTVLDGMNKNGMIDITIVSHGRQEREFIGNIHGWGVKVLNFTRTMIDPTEKPAIRLPFKNLEIKGTLITAYIKE